MLRPSDKQTTGLIRVLDGSSCDVEIAETERIVRAATLGGDVREIEHSFDFRGFAEKNLRDVAKLAAEIRELLRSDVRAILVKGMPLAQSHQDGIRFLFLSLTSGIGRLAITDPLGKRIIWDVSARSDLGPDHTPSITEHSGAAALHTDSSFVERPPRYVALLCVRPARDGSGRTRVLDCHRLVDDLGESEEGRECIRVLRSSRLPFRVPTAFTRSGSDRVPERLVATVFSDRVFMRYRSDCIRDGLKIDEVHRTPQAEWALGVLDRSLERADPTEFLLRAGDLLILDNHATMHGRTAYHEPDRLLLRIRIDSLCRPAVEGHQ